jgi:peroxiredoxin
MTHHVLALVQRDRGLSKKNLVRLSELKGKAVVLAWFPKAFTGG